MSRIEWTDEELEELADRLAPIILSRLQEPDILEITQFLGGSAGGRKRIVGWLDSTQAAEYLGMSRGALHQHTAARTIPFEQDVPGGKCWFKVDELDAWRRGEKGNQT